MAKRVCSELVAQNTETLCKIIIEQNSVNITKVTKMRNRGGHVDRTMLIISAMTPADANKLCEQGLVLAYKIHDCEPYEEAARPKQCYQCHAFGHIAKFCKAAPRCGRYVGAAHTGKPSCLATEPGAKPRCLNCSGPYSAWDRYCPEITA